MRRRRPATSATTPWSPGALHRCDVERVLRLSRPGERAVGGASTRATPRSSWAAPTTTAGSTTTASTRSVRRCRPGRSGSATTAPQDGGASFTSSLVPGYPDDTSPYADRAHVRTATAGDPVLAWDSHGRLFAGAEASDDPAGSKKTFGDVWVATFVNPDGPSGARVNDGKEFRRSVTVARGHLGAEPPGDVPGQDRHRGRPHRRATARTTSTSPTPDSPATPRVEHLLLPLDRPRRARSRTGTC